MGVDAPYSVQEIKEKIPKIFDGYKGDNRRELVPILQEIQNTFNYLPETAMKEAAGFVGVTASDLYGVATFYSQFYFTPQGEHKIKVCQGTACHVRGGDRIMRAVQNELNISPGETTSDYQFTLERVACFGSCALAPVMVVDGKVHGRMTPNKAENLLERLNNA